MTAWLFRLAEKLACLLPEKAVPPMGALAGWLYGSVIRYHRKDALQAIAQCLPEIPAPERSNLVRTMYGHLGRNLIESLRLARIDDDYLARQVEWSGREHLDKVLEQGRGVLALTGHYGNWEMLAAVLPRIGYPMSIVVKEFRQPGLNRAIIESRQRFGIEVIERRNALRPCMRALASNRVLGFMLDQNMIRREGVYVDFFERLTCTSHGLAQMAALSQVPVIPISGYRGEDGRHHVRFHPAVDPPPDRKAATLRRFTQGYTRILEGFIRAHPEQWIWIHRRWRTRIISGEKDALGWDGTGDHPAA